VISGAEFWEKYALLVKKTFFFALKEKGKTCCILKVWIETEHCCI
jgi:hypothetical protein